jgi:hypothetical protein
LKSLLSASQWTAILETTPKALLFQRKEVKERRIVATREVKKMSSFDVLYQCFGESMEDTFASTIKLYRKANEEVEKLTNAIRDHELSVILKFPKYVLRQQVQAYPIIYNALVPSAKRVFKHFEKMGRHASVVTSFVSYSTGSDYHWNSEQLVWKEKYGNSLLNLHQAATCLEWRTFVLCMYRRNMMCIDTMRIVRKCLFGSEFVW